MAYMTTEGENTATDRRSARHFEPECKVADADARAARIRRCAGWMAFPVRARHLEAPARPPRQRRDGLRVLTIARRVAFWLGVLMLAGVMGVGVGAADGPVWHFGADQAAVGDPLHTELEALYRGRLAHTRAFVIDSTALEQGVEGLADRLATRLNADGFYASIHWQDFVEQLAARPRVARAVWRPFLGGPHGHGAVGYLGTVGVCAIVPPDGRPAYAGGALGEDRLETSAPLPDSFWRRVVLIHEFEHCVDYDRGDGVPVQSHGTGSAAARESDAPTIQTHDHGDLQMEIASTKLSPHELYADAATALRLLAAGTPVSDLRRFANLRATGVVAALAEGHMPNLSHFSAPLLDRLLDDVARGRLNPADLDDDSVHAVAAAYRDAALQAAAGFDAERLQDRLVASQGDPARLVRAAGAPAAWGRSLRRITDPRPQG